MNCIVCNCQLRNKQRKFCSRKCHNKYGNYRHQSYLSQRKRGILRKIMLINKLGGKCSNCGYSKNIAALEFHHKNPLEKDSQLDMRKLSNSTLEWCEIEASKCQLLCSNCHAEHHHPHLFFKELLESPALTN